jgi:hypothetical protein
MILEKMPTYEEVSAMLSYDPETGIITRLNCLGGRQAGSVAGCLDRDGYLKLSIKDCTYTGTRIAWLLMTGEWPSYLLDIDHINRDVADNRWSNLRLSTRSENNANSKIRSDNKSGFKGVSWCADRGKWGAYIQVNSKSIGLGRYDILEDAVEAYKAASEKYFGEFAVAA